MSEGFILYNETFLRSDDAANRAHEIAQGMHRYRELLERRRKRSLYEPYAWFRPFNESSRALEPFKSLLQASLPQGAPILDLWCRTGWTGELLAAWFPDSVVTSVWEGDHDQLGYQGYLHWLDATKRAPNLDITFLSLGEPLPFADGQFGFVHGLDTLHRYPRRPLVAECLRVAADDAPILFPHVHLTNSEPDPFFERGCTQLHGNEWGDYLDNVCAGSERSAVVLSERSLYLMDESTALADDRETEHYNGFVAMVPSDWLGQKLTPLVDNDFSVDSPLFLNPMVAFNAGSQRLELQGSRLSGSVGHMAERHPVAIEALEPVLQRVLTTDECLVLSHLVRPATTTQVANRTDRSADDLAQVCRALRDAHVVVAEPVSRSMAQLQGHYSTLQPESDDSFAALWSSLGARYGEREVLVAADGSGFTAAELDQLTSALAHFLSDHGLQPGDRLVMCASNHAEYLLVVWAAWLQGICVVPLTPTATSSSLSDMLERVDARMLVCDAATHQLAVEATRDSGLPGVIIGTSDDDEFDATGTWSELVDVVVGALPREPLDVVETDPEDTALILPTSGTTGDPKLVQLSMRSLMHTGLVLADTFGLTDADRMLSLGASHTMSGLRNPAVGAFRGGATIVVDSGASDSALHAIDACEQRGVTVLCAAPATVETLARLTERVRASTVRNLRLITTTADALNGDDAAVVRGHYDVEVLDYYGLTETGGIVIAVTEGAQGSLGQPVGAAVKVVSDDGTLADHGQAGELLVAGPSLMSGYLLNDNRGVRVHHGWLETGDLVKQHDDGSLSMVGRKRPQQKTRDGQIAASGTDA